MTDQPRSTAVDEQPSVAAADPLETLRAELEQTVGQLPIGERVARFEHANEVLAAELAQLDEV